MKWQNCKDLLYNLKLTFPILCAKIFMKVNMAFEIGPVRLIKEACIFVYVKAMAFSCLYGYRKAFFFFRSLENLCYMAG